MKDLPRIEKVNGLWQLTADGRPLTLFSGELHNSSTSSLDYMETYVWPNLRGLNLNSVVAPVFWELIEPEEGRFDFTLLDGLLAQARRENMRLVLLWFGLWKNGTSTYVPEWVKTDDRRFFRALTATGRKLHTVSPFCEAGIDADKTAFAAVMRRLRETDSETQTVVMVQIENEIGTLDTERDFSPAANAELEQAVPEAVCRRYQVSGTWREAFGEEAGTYLMEYAYARAVEQITAAGRAEYALPCYVNAWLEHFPWRPGTWPAGCPVARFIPMWQAAAPSVALCAPDIYLSDFSGICAQFSAHDNPLFIPEHRKDLRCISDAVYALSSGVLGFAPFGIEDMLAPDEDTLIPDNRQAVFSKRVHPDQHIGEAGEYLARAYALFANMDDLLRQKRAEGAVYPFIRTTEYESGLVLALPDYDIRVTFTDSDPALPRTAGFVIQTGPTEFIVGGSNFEYKFFGKVNDARPVVLSRLEEGTFKDNRFVPGRVLNGDEAWLHLSAMPEVQRVRVFQLD